MNEKVKDLREKSEQAVRDLLWVEGRWNERRLQLEAQMKKTLRNELGEELDRLKALHLEATKAVDLAEDEERLATAPDRLPYPEGTVLVEWSKRRGWDRLEPSGRAAVQVFRLGDEQAATGRRARPGQIVLRRLLAGDKPGKRVEIWDENPAWMSNRWLPEGKKPEKER